jgi:tetratricopeptide (TPR) repeat protein
MFMQAISIDPKNYNAYNLRYFARYGAGKIPMALRDCKEAKKLNPSSKETRGFLAMCYFTLVFC